ncbi:MAG: hypothetical protein COV57_03550 [Candidatus Liptonbacteria bacterium CG11_big_fil_rev_8_21_14_0_20_35_14]|uniref:Small-conductance mechanosensitive ion channel n=1 Tax=Candidatus Liptonbacteria bacterium CG11_big_fil_rev_8_21_14_0_20_35_14 TaxID=1974634 RepID=A0A2H0N6W5_9BACT|nr:MAG: hypothetical protein COV57_03550 [Candidatus Liptonbacteria bacterium CG11_big_fil_rev_8_21_14_0_20_35_14]
MFIEAWSNVVARSLQNLWLDVVSFIPTLLGAIIVFIIGLIVASALGTLVGKIINVLQIDSALKKLGLEKYFDRAGIKLDTGLFFDRVVFWFLVIAFLLAATDILQFFALSAFLRDVLVYIPNIVIAVIIMLAAVVIANFFEKIVKGSVLSAKLRAAKFLGALTWYAIVIFGLLSALSQLNVATTIINTLITGFIAMIALAGGIAFGVGGKDYAAHLIGKFRDKVEG